MPELPDLTIVAEAFHAALVGRPIVRRRPLGPSRCVGRRPARALVGQSSPNQAAREVPDPRRGSRSCRRQPDATGRFQLAQPADKVPTKTAVVLSFGPREAGPKKPAPWTKRADWMPADAATVEVRYRDPTQMGKVYLLPAGLGRTAPGLDDGELGPDADDQVSRSTSGGSGCVDIPAS